MVVLYGNTAVIHPMCAIDEYAMIFRSWVWFSPPHPPIKIDNMAIVNIRFGLIDCEICIVLIMGLVFVMLVIVGLLVVKCLGLLLGLRSGKVRVLVLWLGPGLLLLLLLG